MIETSLTKENIAEISNRTFVDVYDLDYEGLLYLRNVVEDLIKK